MLNIYKASAGSGKTFTLTMEYFKLIFKNRENYKHTLAVTFTNKATEEMKRRIIDELYVLSLGNGKSKYEAELLRCSKELGIKSKEDLYSKAKLLLISILHDYSKLSVSTIDQFFQRVLRAFIRELNQSPSYTIELNTDVVLNRAVENVIERIHQDRTLKIWVEKFINSRIDEGMNSSIVGALIDMGKVLFKERMHEIEQTLFNYKLSDLEELRFDKAKVVKNYQTTLIDLTKELKQVLQNRNISDSQLKGGERGAISTYNNILNKHKYFSSFDDFGKAARNLFDDPEGWFTANKSGLSKEEAKVVSLELFHKSLAIKKFIDDNGKDYETSKAVISNIYQLGVLKVISEEMTKICKEQDSLMLQDSTKILNNLIANNDTSFIYEKLGNVYENIMIDEFQDTSRMQWNNFYPLVLNSIASGNYTLIVGDIKQSIYKFRNGDWTLLAEGVKNDFHNFDIKESILDSNWRSSKCVVDFNNKFFPLAEKYLNCAFNLKINSLNSNAEWLSTISEAYSDAAQKIQNRTKGCVEIFFTPYASNKDEYIPNVMENVLEVIDTLREKDIPYGKCAILVSTSFEGAYVADYLLEKGIPFISNDSLFIDRSLAVSFVIAFLRYLQKPTEAANKFTLLVLFRRLNNITDELTDTNLFDSCKATTKISELLGVELDEVQITALPLFDIVEMCIVTFGIDKIKKEIPYLITFQNLVYTFSTNHTDNISDFLDEWDEKLHTTAINLSENVDAVRILTIHKSKGLEFDHVIIPFFNWDFDKCESILWVNSSKLKSSIPYLPVHNEKTLLNSYFADDYVRELCKSEIDKLNVIYVAMTRASESLHICAIDVAQSSSATNSNNMLRTVLSEMNYKWDFQSENTFIIGEVSQYTNVDSEPQESVIELDSYGAYSDIDKFKIKSSVEDFEPEDEISPREQAIDNGKLNHFILQNIKTVNDVSKAVDVALDMGLLMLSDVDVYVNNMNEYLKQVDKYNWFANKDDIKILNEREIITPADGSLRPDRVVVTDDKISVIDYKFGEEHTAYRKQVSAYCKLLKDMGYKQPIFGYIWYPKSAKIVSLPVI